MWSPKKRFIEDAASAAKVFADVAVSTTFRDAAEVALLDMIATMPDVTDPAQAIAGYHRIMGARTYLRHLATVADPTPPPPARPQSDNLSHS